MKGMSTCLWFNGQAEEAADFYVSMFDDGRITRTSRYLEGAPTPFPVGSVLAVEFTLAGSEYIALNGGPDFTFSPAISIVTNCETQNEIDALWDKLAAEGQEVQCGWVTDKYGVSWQVTPTVLEEMLESDDRAAAQRAYTAMLGMVKLDIAGLERAFAGE